MHVQRENLCMCNGNICARATGTFVHVQHETEKTDSLSKSHLYERMCEVVPKEHERAANIVHYIYRKNDNIRSEDELSFVSSIRILLRARFYNFQ